MIRVPCQNSEKPNDPIPRKHPDKQHDRRMGRPYFIGPFWLSPEGSPTSTTAVDWHLKVKDIEYNVDLTQNY